MTEPLYHTDSYLRQFTAVVAESVEQSVVLDRTAFYPGGGGQPCDLGQLSTPERSYQVTGMSRNGGVQLHELDQPAPPPGTPVTGEVDWERRHQLMRTHTALHILCGVIWRDFHALVTGGDMKPLQARMDFELEQMSAGFAQEVERRANAEVRAARPVSIGFLPRDEAMAHPDLVRTKINLLPPGIAQIRVVDIQGLDVQADGGTHVANTREVGPIRVVGHESKGRINKRLRIALDESAS